MEKIDTRSDLGSQLSQLSSDQMEAIAAYLRELTGEENSHAEDSSQYLTFWCDGQLFGIGIAQVIQIVQMKDITPLPGYPYYMKGVLSVRGEMVPVMDLRLRLGKEEADYSERTCITIIRVAGRSFGLIVDGVNDVENIPEQEICPPPHQSEHKADYLTGIAQREKLILILDMDHILSETEAGDIFTAAKQAAE